MEPAAKENLPHPYANADVFNSKEIDKFCMYEPLVRPLLNQIQAMIVRAKPERGAQLSQEGLLPSITLNATHRFLNT